MWKKEMSVLLSKGLIFLGMGLAIALGIWLPSCVGWLEDFYYRPFGHVPSCVLAYLIIAVLCVLLVFLYKLLDNISKKKVFEKQNTNMLRLISWCCFLAAALLFVWGSLSFVEIVFVAGFTIGFLGLVLRILKNVFEEAVSMKDENDYTI